MMYDFLLALVLLASAGALVALAAGGLLAALLEGAVAAIDEMLSD